MEMGAPKDDVPTREDEREDLKSTATSSLQKGSSIDLCRPPNKHVDVCEPQFAGHLSSDTRVTEHVPSEAS